MLRDINAAVSERAGLTYTDIIMPLKRIHKELVKGSIACATFIPAAWSKLDMIQVAEISANVDSIIVPKKGLAVRGLEDLYGLTIAIPRGSYSGMKIMTDPKINRVLTNGYNQSAAILRAGRGGWMPWLGPTLRFITAWAPRGLGRRISAGLLFF